MYFWENTLFRGRTNPKPMDTFLWLWFFLGIISFFMSSTLLPTKQLWKKVLAGAYCLSREFVQWKIHSLWRQELCHLPIILYPLQYKKQKSRNVVQEITVIKTCQQSKLPCKTINDKRTGIFKRKRARDIYPKNQNNNNFHAEIIT